MQEFHHVSEIHMVAPLEAMHFSSSSTTLTKEQPDHPWEESQKENNPQHHKPLQAPLRPPSPQNSKLKTQNPKEKPTNLVSFGSTLVPSKTSNSTPSLPKPSLTCLMASNSLTTLSVTTSTLLLPKFLKSIPTSLVTPGPKRIDEAAISNAYSFSRVGSIGVA